MLEIVAILAVLMACAAVVCFAVWLFEPPHLPKRKIGPRP